MKSLPPTMSGRWGWMGGSMDLWIARWADGWVRKRVGGEAIGR